MSGKPRLRPLPKTGDADKYRVTAYGRVGDFYVSSQARDTNAHREEVERMLCRVTSQLAKEAAHVR